MQDPEFAQIDWNKMRFWQAWDPVPWWILDREKLQKIAVAQLDFKIDVMQREIEQLKRIRDIVAE
jgi:hypothetical protein